MPSTPTSPSNALRTPTARNPDVPLTMQVAVTVGFVQSCPDCCTLISRLAESCIRDSTVTSFKAVPGSKHAHEVTEGSQALPGLATPPVPVSGPALPVSDVNGNLGPDMPHPMFSQAELDAMLPGSAPNGFDSEGA